MHVPAAAKADIDKSEHIQITGHRFHGVEATHWEQSDLLPQPAKKMVGYNAPGAAAPNPKESTPLTLATGVQVTPPSTERKNG